MRFTLLIMSFMLLNFYSLSQLNLSVVHFRPTSAFGSAMKPTFTAELGTSKRFEDDKKVRMNFSGTLMVFKPKADTFLVYSVITNPDGTSDVRPGYEVTNRYINLMFYGGAEYAPFVFRHTDKVHPFIGMDLMIGFNFYKGETAYSGLSHTQESGNTMIFGGRVKIGLEYDLNDSFSLNGQFGSSAWLLTVPVSIGSGYHYSLGMKYNFN
jgi:hypothetical protein